MTESERHARSQRQAEETAVFCGALLAVCLSLAAIDAWVWPTATEWLRYERVAVLRGELWRLITGHAVHDDAYHLALNMMGTVLIGALFPCTYRASQWLLVVVCSMAAIAAGFLLLQPQLQWYVGASGVLHGMLAAGVIVSWRMHHGQRALALGAVLIGKLAWEQWQGSSPLTTGLPVIVDAHLYGALGGSLAGLWLRKDAGAVAADVR